jgi:hypothetical protein
VLGAISVSNREISDRQFSVSISVWPLFGLVEPRDAYGIVEAKFHEKEISFARHGCGGGNAYFCGVPVFHPARPRRVGVRTQGYVSADAA